LPAMRMESMEQPSLATKGRSLLARAEPTLRSGRSRRCAWVTLGAIALAAARSEIFKWPPPPSVKRSPSALAKAGAVELAVAVMGPAKPFTPRLRLRDLAQRRLQYTY
jgi:hypothetical protein